MSESEITSAAEVIAADDAEFAKIFNLPDPTPVEEAPVPRDEKGRFAKEEASEEQEAEAVEATEAVEEVDDESVDAVAAKAASETVAEEETTEEATEEEATEEEVKPEPRALATKFAVVKGEEAVEPGEIADTVIEYKANGKVYREPLDKVVRLAQSGRYNEALHEEVTELRSKSAEVEGKAGELGSLVKAQREELRRLLEDDEFLMQRRVQWSQRNSPEAENLRLRKQLEEKEESEQRTSLEEEMAGFVVQYLEPAAAKILEQYPTISEDEFLGRYHRTVTPYQKNGIVPREHWGRVQAMLESEIGSWAAHLHESRVAERATATEKSAAEIEAAKKAAKLATEKAAKAKKATARALAPVPGAGGGSERKRKPIVSVNDAEDDIMADVTEFVSQL